MHLAQTDTDSTHPTTQSGPDIQTAPHQAYNTRRSCNVVPSHGRRTGFAIGRVGAHFPLRSSRFSDDFYVNLLANLSEMADLVRLTAFLNK